MEFRDYQKEIIAQGSDVIDSLGFLYLAMEVRTGKTLTSLGIAENLFAERVLFVTKKRAIGSILADYEKLSPSFELDCINYESLHKLPDNVVWDVIILDEAHGMGAFPKPSKRAKDVKTLIAASPVYPHVILLSGTPTPESYSQMYHQVYGIPENPFREYKNFYRFADDYVARKQIKIGGRYINDYSGGYDSIVEAMSPFTISFTQKEADFSTTIEEHVLYVPLDPETKKIADQLEDRLVVELDDGVILADTAVKLMMKLHQIYSGTVKFEEGNTRVLDTNKAQFIHDNFAGIKIGIFYKFRAELDAIKQVYGAENVTDSVEEFDTTDKVIALQIVSGREGISLRNAEYIVYYNIDFSATSYWQSRDRMTTIDRTANTVYWVFSEGGIEDDIYKAVRTKRDYTLRHFERRAISL